MAAKELMTQVKLQVPAGSANPAPPVGPALGQHGLNIQDFCKQFNDKTKDAEKGMALPVVINVYKDRSFDFVIKSAPTAALLKKAAGIQKGSATPHTNKVAKVTMYDLNCFFKFPWGADTMNITSCFEVYNKDLWKANLIFKDRQYKR